MNYTRSIPFAGAPGKALASAPATLAANGFQITDKRDSLLEMVGPGMTSTRQNALVGATKICIRAGRGQLELEADLGGARAMRRFVRVLPLALATGFAVLFGPVMGIIFGQVFGVGFGVPFAPGWLWLAFAVPLAVLPGVPGAFLSPMIARSVHSRTLRALDTLLANMEAAGRD